MRELTEPYKMTVPGFNYGYCENCHKHVDEYFVLNRHAGTNGVTYITDQLVCADCIDDVIQSRYLIRKVSEMTKEIVHQHNKDVYNRVYNNLNFRKL